MAKKPINEYKAAINIKVLPHKVYLDFNEKMIIKAGTIIVYFTNEIPEVSVLNWHIGHKRKRRFLFFRNNKRGCGVYFEGDSVNISELNELKEPINTSKPLYPPEEPDEYF